jgi:two-component system chemotaxis sensor kinase CheA
MSFSPEQVATIEETLNRLTGEVVLAAEGKDDGLIPAYSLLGELQEQCSLEANLRESIIALIAAIEILLDGALPFDAGTLGYLRRFVEWFPDALRAAADGEPYQAMGRGVGNAGSASPRPAGAPARESDRDILLVVDLENNRELLGEFHAETVDHLTQIEAALLALEHKPDGPDALNAIFRSFHTIKGNAGFLGLVPMQKLAHEVESLLDLARNNKLALTSTIITEVLRSRDAIQELTGQVSVALESGQVPREVVPVRHLIESVRALASGQDAPAPAAPAPRAAPVVQAPVATAAVPEATGPATKAPETTSVKSAKAAVPAAPAPGQTVRVNTEKLDSLMDVVGELVIVQSQLIESSKAIGEQAPALQRNVSQLSRIAKELQTTAMSLRMIPVKPTFQKMERLARDLARDCGKKASFVTEGDDTELDRTMVEEIADPLVHMVRNALDHGMEPPEERLEKGKPESGTVRLRAYHQGSNIVVELSDDGRGIDPEKVLKKAQRQGLIPENAQLTREETLNLIFLPGFSTAEKVTSVSGRGVGMDVVKRNIDKLRGKIEITSEVGAGSVFKIKLPLTMAIIDGLVVRVGDDRFILPSTSVQMALRPAKENIVRIQGTGELLDLRGRLLPLHRLYERFNIDSSAKEPWDGIVVILEASGKVCALMIDEMVSKQEVVIKSLGAFMSGLPGVSGGAILGDGNIALILDPGTLLQAA